MLPFLKHSRLLILLLFITLLFQACGFDSRIDYDAHPELLAIKSSYSNPYKKMVKMYSEKYTNDEELNELVVQQAHAIEGAYRLMSPEVSFKYDQLNELSGRDAFMIELERFELEIESSEELPLMDWVKIEKNMIAYLEIRNERVRELKMKTTEVAVDSTAVISTEENH
jgi:hypothetical protein